MLAVNSHALLNLGGEFARGCEDKATYDFVRGWFGNDAQRQALQQRQNETGSFAGSGLRAGEKVTAV